MTTRSEIASRCADEIMALAEQDELVREILELTIMSALQDMEHSSFDRFMSDLGKALKERAEG